MHSIKCDLLKYHERLIKRFSCIYENKILGGDNIYDI